MALEPSNLNNKGNRDINSSPSFYRSRYRTPSPQLNKDRDRDRDRTPPPPPL
jgi:hypothetical protein